MPIPASVSPSTQDSSDPSIRWVTSYKLDWLCSVDDAVMLVMATFSAKQQTEIKNKQIVNIFFCMASPKIFTKTLVFW